MADTFLESAKLPIAVLFAPVVLAKSAPLPIAVLVAIPPPPLPTLKLLTVKSNAPKLTESVAPL